MTDTADYWNDTREYKKSEKYKEKVRKQKSKKKLNASRILSKIKIPIRKMNKGTHWRIGDFDFWPTTGTVINRITKEQFYGVEELARRLLNEKK